MDLFPAEVPTLTYLANKDIFSTINVINYLYDECRNSVGTLHVLSWELDYIDYVYGRVSFHQFIQKVMHGDEGFTPEMRQKMLRDRHISNTVFWKSQIKAMVLFKHFRQQKKLAKV